MFSFRKILAISTVSLLLLCSAVTAMAAGSLSPLNLCAYISGDEVQITLETNTKLNFGGVSGTLEYDKDRMIENDQRADRFLDALDKIKDKPSEIIYGDKVAEKTVIPNVGNYKPEIQSQTMNIPLPPIEQQNPKLLDNE